LFQEDKVQYVIDVLELFSDDVSRGVVNVAERKWIKLFNVLGSDLTNMTEGGDGWNTAPKSPEWKKLISEMNMGKNHPQGRRVTCLNDGLVFDTIRNAARHYDVLEDAIKCYCHGKRKSAVCGLMFIFTDHAQD
jgi:hypothetical protein